MFGRVSVLSPSEIDFKNLLFRENMLSLFATLGFVDQEPVSNFFQCPPWHKLQLNHTAISCPSGYYVWAKTKKESMLFQMLHMSWQS